MRTPIPPFFFCFCQDQSTVAQRAEMTTTECPLRDVCKLVSLMGSHTMLRQHSRLTPNTLGQECMRV